MWLRVYSRTLAQVFVVTLGSVDVTLDREADGGILVKIQAPAWEVNVRASADDLTKLNDIRSADWDERRSVQVGESAEASAFWSCRGDEVTLTIGHDDETWDVAVTFPVAIVQTIVEELPRV